MTSRDWISKPVATGVLFGFNRLIEWHACVMCVHVCVYMCVYVCRDNAGDACLRTFE